MISASTETAVSSAVRLPMSSPQGAWMRASRRRPRPPAAVWPRGRPRSDGSRAPDVAGVGVQRRNQRRLVELGVVGEDQHGVTRAQLHVAHHVLRPPGLDAGHRREPSRPRETVARVGDRHLVADLGGERRQRRREIDRPDDEHLRRRRVGADVDAEVVAERGAVGAEAAHGRLALLQQALGLAGDVAVQQVGRADEPINRSSITASRAPALAPSISVATAAGRPSAVPPGRLPTRRTHRRARA